MIHRRCRKHKGCKGLAGHSGACYDRKGRLLGKLGRVTVIRVDSRDASGKPTSFSRKEL
jgi:hypothetical protein